MARDQEAVARFAAGEAAEIDVPTYKPNALIWINKRFRADSAHAKALAIILAHHNPVDILTGQQIDTAKSLAWTNSKEYHHFFPRDYLKSIGVSNSAANSLANIIMLTAASNNQISNRPPSDYLKDVETAAGGNLQHWLASNLISEVAFRAARENDYLSFLNARAETINRVVSQLGGW
ncbi:MAG: hypothetical protein JW993_10845 [Sedimentisphaerales bacterium]|nr:hypothetical protein [Sedimentisphaerales bacterium]